MSDNRKKIELKLIESLAEIAEFQDGVDFENLSTLFKRAVIRVEEFKGKDAQDLLTFLGEEGKGENLKDRKEAAYIILSLKIEKMNRKELVFFEYQVFLKNPPGEMGEKLKKQITCRTR